MDTLTDKQHASYLGSTRGGPPNEQKDKLIKHISRRRRRHAMLIISLLLGAGQ